MIRRKLFNLIALPLTAVFFLMQIALQRRSPLLHAAEAYWAMGSFYMLIIVALMLRDIIRGRYEVSPGKTVAMITAMLAFGPLAVLFLGKEEKEEEKAEAKV